ncbi:nuclear RNA export factor 1-like [Cloeon dipterum]|uniref:nuclear RNA export factor 1-like n=1 Tax=Cloeon dipterum TaxID=197152 RepID=UPI00321FD27C
MGDLDLLDDILSARQKQQLVFSSAHKFSVSSVHSKISLLKIFLSKGTEENFYSYKFIVKNSTKYSKEFILRSILEANPPMSQKLIPIKFFTENDDSIFYARLCFDVVVGLIRQNLKIQVQESAGPSVLELTIEVGVEASDETQFVNVHDLVALAVQRRVSQGMSASTLNLSSFHSDPDVDAYCFFPLSSVQNLQKVLKIADQYAVGPYQSLDLSNNQLKYLSALLDNLPNFRNLKSLNLEGNQMSLSSLKIISPLPLVELRVHGNELCSLYTSESDYIKDIKAVFPALKVLDGCSLSSHGHAIVRRFFCQQPMSQDFVEQFLTHYYSTFDSDNRHLLFGLYHTDAKFSLTSTLLPGQSTTSNASLNNYLNESRNVLKIIDWAKTRGLLRTGSKQVMDALIKLPKTQHDPLSFTADVLKFEPNHVKISVTGLFKEPQNPFSSVRYFKRNFVLQSVNKVYLILNDMLFITNCTSEQAVSAFQVKTEPAAPLNLYLTTRAMHVPLSNEQKVRMVEKISDITDMNHEWCRRCLEDVQYDLRNALVYFQKNYEERSIPNEAFLK